MNTTYRKTLEEKLEELFKLYDDIYIYGAGVVAKRFYKVIQKRGFEKKIIGFVVTKKEKESEINGKSVFEIEEIKDLEVAVFVAVGDAYQNEIINSLKGKDYSHIVNCYVFSFLDQEYISEHYLDVVPDEIEVNINELMMMQFVGREFIRYDVLVELFNFENGTENYSDLNTEYLFVNPQLKICDDEKKVAKLLYQNREFVNIIVNYEMEKTIADIEWLKRQEKSDELYTYTSRLNKMKEVWYQPLVALIWPPAEALSNDIICEMKKQVRIDSVKECIIDSGKMRDFVKKIYETDDSLEKQIEDKIVRIQKEKESKVVIVEFRMDNPDFCIKRFGHTISKAGMNLKNMLREKYKERINDYVFDVVIHTTDNYAQSVAVRKVIEEFTH